jgi:hypothetical protein
MMPTIEPVDNLEAEVDPEFTWVVPVGEMELELEFEFEFKSESRLVVEVGIGYPDGYYVPVEMPFDPV